MRVTQLALTNFRNYAQLQLALPSGPILLHGANAQGKTTLLEAVYYLATSKSPHANSDRQLINWYAKDLDSQVTVGRLSATVQPVHGARPRNLEIRLIQQGNGQNGPAFRREVLVNGLKVRLMDLLGNLNAVLFLPEDVALVTASPSERRRYLDITLCQVNKRYCRTLSQYNRVLSQRNALLRRLQERRAPARSAGQLDPWDAKLSTLGTSLLMNRAKLIVDLERRAGQIHFGDLTGERESLRLIYLPRLQPNGNGAPAVLPDEAQSDPTGWLLGHPEADIASALLQVLAASRPIEIQRGVTLSGPHRDDLQFLVSGRNLSDFGSRGQQRTAVLALKLAEVSWMEEQTGERPVLLLDEVLAELDQERRAYLLRCVGAAEQAILTATDPNMFTSEFLAQATRLEVAGGKVLKWENG